MNTAGSTPPYITIQRSESTPLITVMCIDNSKEIFKDFLGKSLNSQTIPFDFIHYDSTTHQPQSAASALNLMLTYSRTDWILSAHNDVRFPNSEFLEYFVSEITNLNNAGLVGVIGSINSQLVNRIIQGPDEDMWELKGQEISIPTIVQSVDEAIFALPTKLGKDLRFDEISCPYWDLYGVEFGLQVQKLGYEVLVLPTTVHHLSSGKVGVKYYQTLQLVLKKHSYLNSISTTCGTWNTKTQVWLQRIQHKLASGVKKVLPKMR